MHRTSGFNSRSRRVIPINVPLVPRATKKVGEAPACLLPSLVRCRAVVRLPIRRIAVLIRIKVFLRLSLYDFVHSPDRPIRSFVSWRYHQLRAVGRQNPLPFVRSARRKAQLYGIPQRGADHRVRNPRIPTRRIDDRLARSELPASQPSLNQAQRGTVLHRPARIAPFGLGVEFDIGEFASHSLQAEQWCVTDLT